MSEFDSKRLIGALFAILAAISLAAAMTLLGLCKKTKAETIIVWLTFLSAVQSTIVLLLVDEFRMPSSFMDILLLVLNGILGSIGQYMLTNALKIEQSSVCSLVRSFDIVVSYFFSIVILHEDFTLLRYVHFSLYIRLS